MIFLAKVITLLTASWITMYRMYAILCMLSMYTRYMGHAPIYRYFIYHVYVIYILLCMHFVIYIYIYIYFNVYVYVIYIYISLRHGNTGLVSSVASLTSQREGLSLALVGHPSSDGFTIKMPYGVKLLHRPASHPIFSYRVG